MVNGAEILSLDSGQARLAWGGYQSRLDSPIKRTARLQTTHEAMSHFLPDDVWILNRDNVSQTTQKHGLLFCYEGLFGLSQSR
jgi:hypothetical protein